MGIWLAVGAGGALGAMARFGVSLWAVEHLRTGFPWGTLLVNLTGAVLIGLLHRILPTDISPLIRPFLIAGVLGGYTTFSAFGLETVTLLETGHAARAALYVTASVVLAVLGVMGGAALGEWLVD